MTRIELTRSARQDLVSIARHTQAQWGVRQRNAYLAEIDRALRSPADSPLLGRACDEIREGYRKLPDGRHVIYYRPAADHVLIVRILHALMDVDAVLGH